MQSTSQESLWEKGGALAHLACASSASPRACCKLAIASASSVPRLLSFTSLALSCLVSSRLRLSCSSRRSRSAVCAAVAAVTSACSRCSARERAAATSALNCSASVRACSPSPRASPSRACTSTSSCDSALILSCSACSFDIDLLDASASESW